MIKYLFQRQSPVNLRVLHLLTFLVLLFSKGHALAEVSMCNLSKAAIESASRLRGLKIKEEVPCEVHDKKEVKQYLVDTIKTKLPKERLKQEQLVYRALGIIPEDFNYETGLLNLYLDQLGGYYDPEKNYFVMAGWMPAILQTTVAVHELTHALQDQYFNLDTFMNLKELSGDGQLARSALVEGDATAIMLDYSREVVGQGPISELNDVNSIILQNVLGASMVTASSNVPQSLTMMLIFPYTSGLRFVHALLLKGGYKKVDEAFKSPPVSTEQILHPDLYLKGEKGFEDIDPAELKRMPECSLHKEVFADTMGEFGISALFSMGAKSKLSAAKAAAGWGGDRMVLCYPGSTLDDSKEYSVIWKTLWDTKKDAREFKEALVDLFVVEDQAGSKERDLESVQISKLRTVSIRSKEKEVLVVVQAAR